MTREEKGGTKPTEIEGKIKSNGVEPKSAEAKPENSSLKDKSSASEAKPVAAAEVEVKNTEHLVTPTPTAKPKCSEPDITRNSSSDDVEQQPDQPKQVEAPQPAKVEPSQASEAESEKLVARVVTSPGSQPAPVRTAARRVPPGGHCSQLW